MQQLKSQQLAILKVLYQQHPKVSGERFLEIRRWETPDGNNSDLIVESGNLDEEGELRTESQVFPFYLTVSQIVRTFS